MKSERPGGAELLVAARQVLLSEVLPQLPAEARYTALMVARSMALATAEMRSGDAPSRAELAAAAALYREPPPEAKNEAALAEAVAAMRGRVCRDIRAGRFDGAAARSGELERWLDTITRAALGDPDRKGR